MASPKRAANASEKVAEMYAEYGGLLFWIAEVKFKVPTPDAEGVVQEVMLSLLTTTTDIEDVRSWLIGATCNGSKHYWRRRIVYEQVTAPHGAAVNQLDDGLSERLERSFLVARVLGFLTAKQRETLRLHYFEGLTAVEIAGRLDTTTRYAERLIHRSLKRARAVLEVLARSPQCRGEGTRPSCKE